MLGGHHRYVEADHRAGLARVHAAGAHHVFANDVSLVGANAPLAVQATKESVMRGLALDLDEAYKLESKIASEVFQTEDAKEGPKAFAEKRTPNWQAR